MDYEYEQDRHLRSLARQSHAAEDAALKAIQELEKCHRQRRMLILVCFLSMVMASIFGMLLIYENYGLQ